MDLVMQTRVASSRWTKNAKSNITLC